MIDTVTLNIIHNALTNIAAEMALVMLKTSYSTIFNEGLGMCSCTTTATAAAATSPST
jgi:N-methylhydantoinase B/oxoprolinase/acetone carboxylase alpha subunit